MNTSTKLEDNEFAQRALLKQLLYDNEIITEVSTSLNADMFTVKDYKTIYTAIINIRKKGILIDYASLNQEVANILEIGLVTASQLTIDIMAYLPPAQNYKYYEKLIIDNYNASHITDIMLDINSKIKSNSDIDTIKNDMILQLKNLKTDYDEEEKDEDTFENVLHEALADMKKYMNEEATLTSIPIIDKHMGGLFKGELTVIGGKPSDGKSAVALQIVKCLAEQSVPVLICNFEMSKSQIGMRFLSMETEISTQEMKKGTTQTNYDRANKKVSDMLNTRSVK